MRYLPSTTYPARYTQHDNNQDMSDAMMPISVDALYYRTMLFELSKPFTISGEMFDDAWLYVDSVYTKLQSELLSSGYSTRSEVRVQTSKKQEVKHSSRWEC